MLTFRRFMEKKLSYIIAVISEFAQAHTLNLQQAYRYLMRYKGLEFIDQHYDIEHTLSFEDVIEEFTKQFKDINLDEQQKKLEDTLNELRQVETEKEAILNG